MIGEVLNSAPCRVTQWLLRWFVPSLALAAALRGDWGEAGWLTGVMAQAWTIELVRQDRNAWRDEADLWIREVGRVGR